MENNVETAVKFLCSARGRLIVGDALRIAIESLNYLPEARRPVSNISDMEFLLENFAINLPRGDNGEV